jgi:hypothetical protein
MGNQIYFKIAGKKKNWTKGRTARHIFGREPSMMSFLTYITGFFMNLELLPSLTDYEN